MLTNSSRRRHGGSALEAALLFPWYIFLFVGALDMGFYAHALISVQSAARVAALYTSTNTATQADATTACTLVLSELKVAANLRGVTSCAALPVIVTATGVTGADGQAASQVSVQYQTLGLIPIPGLLSNQFTFGAVTQMRLRG